MLVIVKFKAFVYVESRYTFFFGANVLLKNLNFAIWFTVYEKKLFPKYMNCMH